MIRLVRNDQEAKYEHALPRIWPAASEYVFAYKNWFNMETAQQHNMEIEPENLEFLRCQARSEI